MFVDQDALARRQVAATEDGDITLNFANADLREVVRSVLGDLLKLNYVIDPALQGSITMQTSRPLARSAVLPALESALPYEPFIGTPGVSPEIEAVTSLQPDYWGGNMDLPDVAPGAIVYFPVHHEDAYLYLGDCHATQGDGEICGVAVEIPSTTTVRVDLIKDWPIAWPRLENDRLIMTIGSARPMEDAARIAYRELIRWLVADFGFDEVEAYFFLTQAGRVRLGNMVDPKYTLGASVLKSYLS